MKDDVHENGLRPFFIHFAFMAGQGCVFSWMKFYYTYVLLSLQDHKFYIGYSTNVFRRLEQHNEGLNKSTKSRTPFILLYYEAHLSSNDAQRRESYFKTSPGKRTLLKMLRESLAEYQIE